MIGLKRKWVEGGSGGWGFCKEGTKEGRKEVGGFFGKHAGKREGKRKEDLLMWSYRHPHPRPPDALPLRTGQTGLYGYRVSGHWDRVLRREGAFYLH